MKRIPTSQLTRGMFLVGVDESWWKSPFFRHNRLLETQKEVDLLRKSEIKEVIIDPSRGLDVGEHDQTEVFEAESRQTDVLVDNDAQGGTTFNQGDESKPAVHSHEPTSSHVAEEVRNDAIKAMESIFDGIKTGEAIDEPKLQRTVNALLQRVMTQGEGLVEAMLIQNLRQFDKALYGHVVDVAVLSTMVGIQLGMNEESLRLLALAGLLHDVGHVRVPRNILRRKHLLVGDEQAVFERHVEWSLTILGECQTIPPEVHRVVKEHHERQDGSGYPDHLTAEHLCDLSDVVALIDQFDLLVSPWGLQPSTPTALAMRSLYRDAHAGKLRAVSVEALIRCVGVYPLGSLVSLSTGERAIVIKTNPLERLKPTVKIIVDAQGKRCHVPITEDLAAHSPKQGERVIQDILNPASLKIDLAKYL
ncbi:MAG: DUF3391 domain-containing protein [Nitrospirales bacterium]|nr:DUF3391 domain-containing protein [Nitrospira sp.]MDR4502316.1 DUF3391 domain-containing protein [Nitrospirales bacterium]